MATQQSVYDSFIRSGKATPIASTTSGAPTVPATPRFNQQQGILGRTAQQGRNGDSRVAHVTPGEVVIPWQVAARNPGLLAHASKAISDMGGNPAQYQVGRGKVNPASGIEEFSTSAAINQWLSANPGASDATKSDAMKQYGVSPAQVAAATAPKPVDPTATKNSTINAWLNKNPNLPDKDLFGAANYYGLTIPELSAATGQDPYLLQSRYDATQKPALAPKPPPVQAKPYDATQLAAPTQWQLTDDQTVSGQLNKNLASGSPTMQLAETQGLQRGAGRGLLNSSMAIGEAQNAMISSALPIAQADATANLGVNRYNVDTANTFATTNAASDNAAKSFGAQQTNATNQFNVQQATQVDQFNVGNEVDRQTAAQLNADKVTAANFEANVRASLAQITNEQNFDLQTQSITGAMVNDFVKAMQQINQDTNMDQQSKDYSIGQLFGAVKSGISLISAVGSVPNVAELLINGGP